MRNYAACNSRAYKKTLNTVSLEVFLNLILIFKPINNIPSLIILSTYMGYINKTAIYILPHARNGHKLAQDFIIFSGKEIEYHLS